MNRKLEILTFALSLGLSSFVLACDEHEHHGDEAGEAGETDETGAEGESIGHGVGSESDDGSEGEATDSQSIDDEAEGSDTHDTGPDFEQLCAQTCSLAESCLDDPPADCLDECVATFEQVPSSCADAVGELASCVGALSCEQYAQYLAGVSPFPCEDEQAAAVCDEEL